MDKLKRTLVTLLACFTVLCLSVGMIPWGKVVTPTTAKAETQADGYDLDGDGTINYVAFGDSVTNGYGHPGYYLALQKHEMEGHTFDPSNRTCYVNGNAVECYYKESGGEYNSAEYLKHSNSAGYLANAPEAYPSKVAKGLETATGMDVNLLNMAISGMRIEELRLLLDKDYKGDGYTRRKFFADRTVDQYAESYFDWTRNAFKGGLLYYDAERMSINAETNPEVNAIYQEFLHDYVFEDKTFSKDNRTIKNVAKLAGEFQYAISNAEVISIGLGTNNFGTASESALYRMIASIFGAQVGDTYQYNYDLEGLLAEYPTMVAYAQGIQTKLLNMFRFALGEQAFNQYVVAIQDVVDTYAYGLIGFISSYKVVLDKVHALNPNAKIVLVGTTNMEYGLEFEMNGIKIPFGDIYEALIQTANLWLNNYACTLNSERQTNDVYFAQPETSPDVIINDLGRGVWNRYVVDYMTNDIASRFGVAGFDQYVFAQLLNILGMKYEYVGEYNLNDMELLRSAFGRLLSAMAPSELPNLPYLIFGRDEQRYPYVLAPDYTLISNQLTGLLQVYDVAMQLLVAMEKSAREITNIDLMAVAGLMFDNDRLGALLKDPTNYETSDAQQFLYFFARMMFASAAGVHPSETGAQSIATEIVETLENNVTAQERFDEKLAVIKATYTAKFEALFSQDIVDFVNNVFDLLVEKGYKAQAMQFIFDIQAEVDSDDPQGAQQVILEAKQWYQGLKTEATSPLDYVVNEDSYFVSLGDSQLTGHGLPGYENYGHGVQVEGSAPYELAKALYGEEASERYSQLLLGGVRADDLRWILDSSFTPDTYSTGYVLNSLISYAGVENIDQARALFVSEIQKADLISLSIGGGNITTYVGQQINNVLTYGRPLYTNDWSNYLTAEGEAKLMALIQKLTNMVVTKSGIALDQDGYANLAGMNVHFETLVETVIESFIYGYFGYTINLPKVADLVRAINPTAQIMVLGYFNPVDEMTITIGEGEGAVTLPIGQWAGKFIKLTNTQTSMISLFRDNVTFIDVKEATCFFDENVANGSSVTILDYMNAVFENSYMTHADQAGHQYMKNQMLAGLTVTCAHVWDNACDAICNTCGATRTPADHVYDHDCDADCNVCGAVRTPYDHVYTDCEDQTCDVCQAIRVSPGHAWDNACDTQCNNCTATREITHTYDHDCDADCNVCGETRTPFDHVYDHNCDADCNVCGAVRTPFDHVWVNDCDADCDVCGATRTPSDHVWTNACDVDCNVCGATRTPADHVFDDDCHDQTCNVCGETARAYAEHVYAHACSENCENCTAGTRVDVEHTFDNNCQDTDCNVCGKQNAREAVEHVYATDCDATCANCEYVRVAPASHTYDSECDEACNACGYERETNTSHVYDYDCDAVCNACGEVRNAGHVYDHNCDVDCNACGAERTPFDHVYDNGKDSTCNVCGHVREREVLSGFNFGCGGYVDGLIALISLAGIAVFKTVIDKKRR